jgi:2-phospho-L-lactate/phosphoenolpyruvate guanylyltransferase
VRTLAIVPVKSFDVAKQRLGGALARGARESLAQAMFADVLAALRHARRVDAIAVVTAEPAAESLAGQDAIVLPDDHRAGQSAAADIGVRYAIAAGVDRVALIPGDTPMLDPAELDALLDRTAADRIAVGIVADRHGTGTNALVLAPPDALVPSFGPDSLARHVTRAKEAGVAHRLEEAPSLAHDVDTPDDLVALAASLDGARGGAQCTRGALRQLERSGALDGLASRTAGAVARE